MGGKSDLLLGVARLHYSNCLILRRTYDRLEESIILRAREFYGDLRHYNQSKHFWHLPGCRVKFGHCKDEKDALNYKSAAYDFIGFDELTEFTRFQYDYIKSRLRRAGDGKRTRKTDGKKRPRIIACTNPGGDGNDWVMQVWAPWLDEKHPNPAAPGEIRYFKRTDEGVEISCDKDTEKAISRTFIPALLKDNPYATEDYERMLSNMPEPYRSQLLRGDWTAGIVDDRWQVIPTAWVKAAQERWRSNGRDREVIDCLGTDVAHGGDDQTVLSRRYGNHFAELEKHPGRTTPDGQSVSGLVRTAITNGALRVNIDAIGYGASAYDFLKDIPEVKAFVGSEKSTHKDKSGKLGFANKRAESWWSFREALDPHSGDNLELPLDPELLADLTSARWKMTATGIQIEKKEEIIKRIGRSPDCGEAVIYAYWGMADPPAVAGTVQPGENAFIRKRIW